METKKCVFCGEVFVPNQKKQMFCSVKCKNDSRYRDKVGGVYKEGKHCQMCNEKFVPVNGAKMCPKCIAWVKSGGGKIQKKEPAPKLPTPPRAMYKLASEIGFSHGQIMGFFELGILEKKVQAKIKEEHGDRIYQTDFGGGKGRRTSYC